MRKDKEQSEKRQNNYTEDLCVIPDNTFDIIVFPLILFW